MHERLKTYENYVAQMYERGKALNTAALFELDNTRDPADTRTGVIGGLNSVQPPRRGKKRPFVDGW